MIFLTDDDVARLVSPSDALDAVTSAFSAFATGDAAVQRRERTDAGGVKLSTLGAVVPSAGVLGAKVYSTVGGRFTFLVVLFSSDDGRRLAVLESGALTRLRTAATSVLSTRLLHPGDVGHVVVFGSGVQGHGHADAFTSACPDVAVRIVGRATPGDEVEKAVADADVVVTATRSLMPVLRGAWLPDGAHVCAVGSSRADTRELDDDAYRRASVIAVEWLAQARGEAGGLVQAAEDGVVDWRDVVELGDVVTGRHPGRRRATDVTVFQSVGIGLEDVAVAAAAWRHAVATRTGMSLEPPTQN